MRIGTSRPRALATLLAGLLTLGSNANSASSREISVTYAGQLANYSCGCSRGFSPHSLFIPVTGTNGAGFMYVAGGNQAAFAIIKRHFLLEWIE